MLIYAHMPKQRLDLLLVERRLAESRSLAQRLIMAGQVRVDGQVVIKPSSSVDPRAGIEVDQGPPFVSRGGEKLSAALDAFNVSPNGKVCADVGASTGGFTDCLLQHGAAKVYAIDVGEGILHWKLRNDPRVVVMEKTNARYLASLPEAIELVSVDVSFISLKVILPVVRAWLARPADVIALIKPQFEAGRREVARGDGVIRDVQVHRRVLEETLSFAHEQGYSVLGLLASPITGPKGNIEFLAWLGWTDGGPAGVDSGLIDNVLPDRESPTETN